MLHYCHKLVDHLLPKTMVERQQRMSRDEFFTFA